VDGSGSFGVVSERRVVTGGGELGSGVFGGVVTGGLLVVFGDEFATLGGV